MPKGGIGAIAPLIRHCSYISDRSMQSPQNFNHVDFITVNGQASACR